MDRLIGNLIVVSPKSPRVFKFQLTKTAILILALSCLISFGVVVVFGYILPAMAPENDHVRLVSENADLRVKNKNISIRADQLSERVAKLEEQTRRIDALMQTE